MWSQVGLRKHPYEQKLVEMMEFQLSYFKSWKMMLWKCCTQYTSKLENSAVVTGLEKVSFHTIPKKGNAKECSNYCTIVLISHASKVMLKIIQARLQHYMNHELPDVQAGFRKGRGTRDQITNIHWIIKMKYYSTIKGNKILLFAAIWIDLQKSRSKSGKDKHCMISFIRI